MENKKPMCSACGSGNVYVKGVEIKKVVCKRCGHEGNLERKKEKKN